MRHELHEHVSQPTKTSAHPRKLLHKDLNDLNTFGQGCVIDGLASDMATSHRDSHLPIRVLLLGLRAHLGDPWL